jgi:hypothetical protein
MDLSKYLNAFGSPNQGIHTHLFLNLAVIDIVITAAAAGAISYFYNIPFIYTNISMFGLGIVSHRLFHVRTTVDKLLFPQNKN